MPDYEDIAGLAWSARLYEKEHPEKTIPGRQTCTEFFAEEDEELHMRDSLLGQSLALSRDLKLLPSELLSVITTPESPDPDDEDADQDLPVSASDVPLSRPGSLYLFCSLLASSLLFSAPTIIPPFDLLPAFASILELSLSSSIGSESRPIIDSVLFIGHALLSKSEGLHSLSQEESDTIKYTLQRLSLLSANTPSSTLRYQAHLLTSGLLHHHPDLAARMTFIKDTLENCPYETLKASAVGWLKDEILLSQQKLVPPPPSTTDTPSDEPIKATAHDEEEDIFMSANTLPSLAPCLLLNPSTLIEGHSRDAAYGIFAHYQPFFLAVLNLLYLLLSSPTLFKTLDFRGFDRTSDVIGWCDRLRAATLLFQGWMIVGNGGGKERGADVGEQETEGQTDGEDLVELRLLEGGIEQVMQAVGKVGM